MSEFLDESHKTGFTDGLHKSKHEHFPPFINEKQGIALYRFLVEQSFIVATTDEASFLFLIGCASEQPMELHKIIWAKNKQLLREMLEQLFNTLIGNRCLRIADLERLTPLCFVSIKHESFKLANRTKHPSTDSDKLKNFIATLLRPSC